MLAKLEVYYHCKTFAFESRLALHLMKEFQRQVRQAFFSCDPMLLRDVSQKGKNQRVFQPYSLEPLYQVEPGVLKASIKLLHPQADQILLQFARHWKLSRKQLNFQAEQFELIMMSEVDKISAASLGYPPDQAQRLALHFISPLVLGAGYSYLHKQKRQITGYPLPDPGRIFYALWESWNQHFPAMTLKDDIPESADREMEILQLDNGCVQTFKLAPQIVKQGFTGSVLFSLPKDKACRYAILRLAKFAEWSGTGRQSSLGLGWTQTEILE